MSTRAGASFGTNSPPLEATGEEQPMGLSSVEGGQPQKAKLDGEQRGGKLVRMRANFHGEC